MYFLQSAFFIDVGSEHVNNKEYLSLSNIELLSREPNIFTEKL